jgi:hypothetical protein
MKKIVIHIGPHKTGSTYIQKMFYENRAALKETSVCYPEKGIGPQWGHCKLVEAIMQRDKSFLEVFFEKINDYSNTIISSENFWRLSADDLVFFKDYLLNFYIEVVFFKRDFMGLLLSSWQESVKHGGTVDWSQSLLRHVLRPFESQILNCGKTLEIWQEILHPERINIRNYDYILERNGNIFDEFLSSCSLDTNIQNQATDLVNKSLDFSSVELIRNLNRALKQKNILVHHNVREMYLKGRSASLDIEYIENFISNTRTKMSAESWGCETFEINFFKKFPEADREKSPLAGHKLYEMPNNDFMFDEACHYKFGELVDKFEKDLASLD